MIVTDWIGLSPAALMLFCAAVLAASVLRGFSGFGFALAAVPLIAMIVAPARAVAIVVVMQAVMGVRDLLQQRALLDRPGLAWLSLGAVVGTPIGIAGLLLLDPPTIRLAIAAIVTIGVLLLLQSLIPMRSRDCRAINRLTLAQMPQAVTCRLRGQKRRTDLGTSGRLSANCCTSTFIAGQDRPDTMSGWWGPASKPPSSSRSSSIRSINSVAKAAISGSSELVRANKPFRRAERPRGMSSYPLKPSDVVREVLKALHPTHAPAGVPAL